MSVKMMCSVCLTCSDSIRPVTTLRLRLYYKRLASPEGNLFPAMQIKMCYLCHAAFLKIVKFIEISSESYEKLKKCNHYSLQDPHMIISQEESKVHNLAITTIPSVTINGQSDNTGCSNVIVKQEYIDPNETSRISTGENDSEQHHIQTNIETENSPTQTIQTVSPFSNKRISVTLSLPANHTIKKMSSVLNPAQKEPPAKSVPFSQIVTKNKILLNAEKNKKNNVQISNAKLSVQSLLKDIPKTKRPNKTLPKKEVPASKLNTKPSQVNAIPRILPNIAPKKSVPTLVPIPASSSFPVFTSTKQNNGTKISFTASAPPTVPVPTLVPFTYKAPNSALPTDQSQNRSKMLTGPSKSKTNNITPYIIYNAPYAMPKKNFKKLSRTFKPKDTMITRPIYFINTSGTRQKLKKKVIYPINKSIESDDSKKSNINDPMIKVNSTDANNMNENAAKLIQKGHNTGVNNLMKIAPKPDCGVNNSMPGLAEISDKAQVKEVESVKRFSYENKNLEMICKVDEDIEHLKIWYGDDPMEEAEQK